MISKQTKQKNFEVLRIDTRFNHTSVMCQKKYTEYFGDFGVLSNIIPITSQIMKGIGGDIRGI